MGELKKQNAPAEKNKIDVVYVLGTGSKWDNNELRFSIRSITKNLKNFRNIVVVGECPKWLTNVIHFPYPDVYGPGNADGNIIEKVKHAIKCEDLTDDFLFINDDHYILKPVNAKDIPAYHKGCLTSYPDTHWDNSLWRTRLFNTMNVLRLKGFSSFNYDIHVPILFNKHKFLKAIDLFDYKKGIGFTMKSLYGNVNCEGVFIGDKKQRVFSFLTMAEIKKFMDADFLTVNDNGLNANCRYALQQRFPKKSKYELDDYKPDTKVQLLDWLNSDGDYSTGLELFVQLSKNKNLMKVFSRGRSNILEQKLRYELEKLTLFN